MKDDIFYIVETKSSKCSCCGKKIKNVYHFNGKEYGYYCFMNLIGSSVDKNNSKEKPLPSWIFNLMNQYIELKKDKLEDKLEDFECNFWNEGNFDLKCPKNGGVYSSSVMINNKRIPLYQQYQISDYLQMRYNYIKKGK